MAWLYLKRKYLIVSFVGFIIAFVAIHFHIEAGDKEITGGTLYLLLFYIWASLISLYIHWLTHTLHGESKNESTTKKILIMAFPTLFLMMAIYVSTIFISGV